MPDQQESALAGFSVLEDALHSDLAGEKLMSELEWVSELSASTQATMQVGLPSESHAAAKELADACMAAEIILKTPPTRKG